MRISFLKGFIFSVVLLVTPSTFALNIPNFQKVTSDIFRGGRPINNDLTQIQNKYNIKTNIDLEDDSFYIQKEFDLTKLIGMDFLSYPMNAGKTPSDKQVSKILADLQDEKKFPIFIHCKHGQDRTGLIIGLYRVQVQGYSPAQAYQEMLDIGYHPKYYALDNYFRKVTGYNGHRQ